MSDDPKNLKFTDSALKCPHCGNQKVATIIGRYNRVESHEEHGHAWDAGFVYELLACQSCRAPILRRCHFFSEEPEICDWEILYPTIQKEIEGLPPKVQTAFSAATRIKEIDANAFGVLLGRVLELVCADRGVEGRTLNEKLDGLAKKNEIPPRVAELAHGIRKFRNVGAHAYLGELTAAEVPFLEQLCTVVLEYVYTAPLMVAKAELRLSDISRRE
jgi:hypothetical protein